VLSELRLDAERAITLLAEARAAGKLDNQEALDALELGARRIDFVGLKFQAADECVSLYNQARQLAESGDKARRDEVSELLYSIGSNNGGFDDIRDGYTLLRDLYRQAWLRDNRPYWLQTNMDRYDMSAQLWIARGDRWQTQVIQQCTTRIRCPRRKRLGCLQGRPRSRKRRRRSRGNGGRRDRSREQDQGTEVRKSAKKNPSRLTTSPASRRSGAVNIGPS